MNEHLLKATDILQIKGLNNGTLLGQGQWVQGSHQSVIQSSVIIKCTYNTSIAINVYATTVIHINNLIITYCSRGIVIDSVLDAQLNNLSVRNSSEFGLWIYKAWTVTIYSSSFSHNGINVHLNLVNIVSISYSDFTYAHQYTYNGTGLSIQNDLPNTRITITLICCFVHSNIGGGALIHSANSVNDTVVIQNTIFSNNNGHVGGYLM